MTKLVALLALGGCSFATMQRPQGSPPECTESQTAPAIDVAIAVASPIVTYFILEANGFPNTGDTSSPTNDSADQFIRGVAALGVSFPAWLIAGGSSIYGFIRADQCHRTKRDYQQLMAAPPQPGPYMPPPAPPPPGQP